MLQPILRRVLQNCSSKYSKTVNTLAVIYCDTDRNKIQLHINEYISKIKNTFNLLSTSFSCVKYLKLNHTIKSSKKIFK